LLQIISEKHCFIPQNITVTYSLASPSFVELGKVISLDYMITYSKLQESRYNNLSTTPFNKLDYLLIIIFRLWTEV